MGAVVFLQLGCGVRGDPMPPEKPVALGRGKPNYDRATENMAFPKLPPVPGKNEDQEVEEDEDEKF